MSIPIRRVGRVLPHKSEETVAYQRLTQLDDIKKIADNMREEDMAEIKAQSGLEPLASLFYCFFKSSPCMTMISRHGHRMGMWGVVPESETSGRIWMLGCQSMLDDTKDKRTFLRQSKIELRKILKEYPVLFNVVDSRNEVHVRWLQWMGFTFIKKHSEYGPEKRPFYEFVRI